MCVWILFKKSIMTMQGSEYALWAIYFSTYRKKYDMHLAKYNSTNSVLNMPGFWLSGKVYTWNNFRKKHEYTFGSTYANVMKNMVLNKLAFERNENWIGFWMCGNACEYS